MRRLPNFKVYIALVAILLSGCAPVTYQTPFGEAPPTEVELVPPVPTFVSLGDCEMAYGPGACGTGQIIYQQVNLVPPIVDRVFKTTFTRGLSYGPSKGLSKNDRIKETQGAYG